MRVSKINIYQTNKNNSINTRTYSTESRAINFKAAETLIYIGGKAVVLTTVNGIKGSKLASFKKNFEKVLENPSKFKSDDIAYRLIQLGKTPYKEDHSINPITFFANVFKGGRYRLEDIKAMTFKDLFPKLNNSNPTLLLAKKEFVRAMYDNAEYADDSYIEGFKALPNKYFANLKQDIANKALYTPMQKIDKSEPDKHFYQFKLIEALNDGTGVHNPYLIDNKNAIENLYTISQAQAVKTLTEKKNQAFAMYSHKFMFNGIDYRVEPEKNGWRISMKEFFEKTVKDADHNPERLAKALNIDEILAKEIFKDFDIADQVINGTNDIQLKNIIRKRVDEKIHSKLKVIDEPWSENNEFRNCRTKLFGTFSFMNMLAVKGYKYSDGFLKELQDIIGKQVDKDADNPFITYTGLPGFSDLEDSISKTFLNDNFNNIPY